MPARHLTRWSALPLTLPTRLTLATALVSLLALLPRSAAAQSVNLLPDATVLPRHTAGFRLFTAWTRYDELIGTGDVRNIGSTFSTDSLGSAQIPRFAVAENAVRALGALPNFRLTAGNLVAIANSRIVTAPLIAQYGLTSRLTIGVAIPLVETRSTVYAQLNPATGKANVGPNPAIAMQTASGANAALVAQLRGAATTLQTRLTDCQATPTGTGCSAIIGHESAIQSLLETTGSFASGVESLYGTGETLPGQQFVPIAGTPAQMAIDARLQGLRTQYQGFLGTNGITGALAPAGGPGARAEMQALLAAAGRDSLRSTDRASIGDISLGASFQLANSYGDSAAAQGGFRYRLTVNGTVRIGTGQPANTNRLFDIGTGTSQNGLGGGVAADVQLARRVSASVIGSYMAQLGSVDVARVPSAGLGPFPLTSIVGGTYSAGIVMSLSVNPRYRLGGLLAITGAYSLLRVGADRYTLPVIPESPSSEPSEPLPLPPFGADAWTAQQVGVGFVYSTIVGTDRGPGRLPVEVSFNHLETLAANGGPAPKTFRDQLEIRVFLR